MKKAYIKLIITIFIAVFFVSNFAEAAIIRTDKVATVNSEEKLSENVYLVGNHPKISGEVDADVFAAGNKVEIDGNLNGDFLSIGSDILVKGNVNGDVRVLGGSVLVENTISGDLVVIGSQVTIADTANIDGDVILIGGVVNIKNAAERHLRVIAGTTNIYGKVLNTANITSQNINILKSSEVVGHISYFSPRQALIEDGAKLTGSVNFNKVNSIRDNGLVKHTIVSFLNFWMLFRFITTLILTFILVYVFKIFSQKTSTTSIQNWWKSLLVGLIATIFIPVIVIICLISLILIPVGFLILMLYIGVLILSTAVAGISLGALIKKLFSKKQNLEISFQTATLGVVILTLLQFVDFLGDITRLGFVLTAFGSIWIYLYEKVRWGDFK